MTTPKPSTSPDLVNATELRARLTKAVEDGVRDGLHPRTDLSRMVGTPAATPKCTRCGAQDVPLTDEGAESRCWAGCRKAGDAKPYACAECAAALMLLNATRGILGCTDPPTDIVADAECVRQLAINFRGALSRLLESPTSDVRRAEAQGVLDGREYDPADSIVPSSRLPSPEGSLLIVLDEAALRIELGALRELARWVRIQRRDSPHSLCIGLREALDALPKESA